MHRFLLFKSKDPVDIPVYDNYDGIDIFLKDANSDRDIIFCHGSKLSGKVYNILLNDMSRHTKCNVISFNLKGMLNSRGISSEKGIRKEVDSFISCYLQKRNKKVIVFGQSLGCCLAIQIGRKLGINKVILENPFINYKSLIKSLYKYDFVSYFVVDKWCNNKISELKSALFLISDNDTLIKNEDGKHLQSLTNNSKIAFLNGSNHFNANRNRHFYQHIINYINN
ncbi:alpha/beta hydrolase [Vairimorpha necatrix]|uniref:Alpha/beta hydrolase n=1 Tax=Vairimorpha necatrix TaxID=6039 RepID=A0AAX4J9V6_9MICR